jgi:hypothetical protein
VLVCVVHTVVFGRYIRILIKDSGKLWPILASVS